MTGSSVRHSNEEVSMRRSLQGVSSCSLAERQHAPHRGLIKVLKVWPDSVTTLLADVTWKER